MSIRPTGRSRASRAPRSTPSARRPRTTPTGRRLRVAMTVLVATDLVGGLLAVSSGVNTWPEAWGSKALLAAPVPMIAVQVVLTVLATRGNRRGAAVAAGTLGVACFVSVMSGFFDGGIGNDELTPGLSAYQAFLLLVTGAVGALASLRAREAMRP